MLQSAFSFLYIFFGFLISGFSTEIETLPESWMPGRVKAICAGNDKSFYLNTTGNPCLIKADLNGKVLKSWGLGKNHHQISPKDTALLTGLKAMVADKKGNIFFIRQSAAAVYKLQNNRIRIFARFDSEAFKEEPWAGFRMDITIDAANNLYVIDGLTQSIWKIDPLGNIVNLNLKLKMDLVSKNQRGFEKAYIAALPNGELFFTSFSEENEYFPDISFLGSEGNLKKMVNGHKDVIKYADGPFAETSALKAYNLKTDRDGNLYFADAVSWAAGKTFWHFSSIRKVSSDGILETIAGCGSAPKETNSITTPYNAALRGRDFKELTINGKEITFNNYPQVKHQSLLYDDEFSIKMENLGESKYGLFFRTDDFRDLLFAVTNTNELVIVTDNAPLISEQVIQGTHFPGSKENQIRLTKVTLKDGVKCHPIIIH